MAIPERSVEPTPHGAQRWLSIIGIGEDGVEGLSPVARQLIAAAELVVGGERHLTLADSLIKGRRLTWPNPIEGAFPQILASRGGPVAVIASGDPYHFGIGKQLAALVASNEILCLPQPSAFSLAAARMGWALQDVQTLSLHGRDLRGIVRHLHPGARILALSWDSATPAKLATLLTERQLGASRLTVLERMGGPRERIHRSTAAVGFDSSNIDALNTIALEVVGQPSALAPTFSSGRNDDLFANDGQLTKREVRAITLASLAPRYGELLWDIGLGAGSVALEWLLADRSLRAIGIEEHSERAANAARNAATLGTPELQIVTGRAPDALAGLQPPDAVFIGGGLGDGVLAAAWTALKPGGRIVANAVTLEGEATLFSAFQQFGGELTRIELARANKIGNLWGWRSAMPVTHWLAVKP
ncbi:precorrin-6y C5,15-methyltransferase (decarboxylating) subunit CbiE [Hyphomicrobium sp. xq]|uniref:Precorrin-6y C5,15-methyltransferase (Decarboxylating) subunit CbiE n=1 Tax=Hyphomicrobium album TaxID=2665159 RepID=A0A6I3KLE3_9HYPH|nr:precorrin-6y C5,15-methyltransferase (decarboxylating) subunit CbiE [Hyphomicrobium album]MTD94760.1 precorrin-6y C5,15-methyltransferase (decarboxylating) subunit CbiE [Hyphomicrobium album]